MKTKKIFIDDTQVETYPGSVNIGLTFEISDITDLTVRRNSRSTTIRLPASAVNKKKFGVPEDWNAANYIGQNQRPVAKIEVEGTNLIRGIAKIDSTTTNDRISEYLLKILGDNADWRERIKGKKLNDLDYSSENHVLNIANIVASWTVSSARSYVYDLIDRGQFTGLLSQTTGGTVNVMDCYPAISFKSFLDKIFKAINYKVVSNFRDGAEFSGLYWAFINSTFKHPDTYADDKKFKIGLNESGGVFSIYQFSSPADVSKRIPLTNKTTFTCFDTGGNISTAWDGTNIPPTYRVPVDSRYKFHYKITYRVIKNQSFNNTQGYYTAFEIYKTTKPWDLQTFVEVRLHQQQILFPSGNQILTAEFTAEFDLKQFDVIWMQARIVGATFNTIHLELQNHSATVDTYFELLEMTPPFLVGAGETVEINENLPDISQLSFLQGIKEAFNLIFLPDIETRTIYIEPEDDFHFTTIPAHADWSKKLDKNKPIDIEFIGETYAKKINYAFKQDSKYKFIAEKNKQEEVEFGSQEVSIANQFAKDEIQEFQNSLFAATWMDFTPSNPTTGLRSVKLPRMWAGVTLPIKSTAFAPRILFYAGKKELVSTDRWWLSQRQRPANTFQQVFDGFLQQAYYPRFYSYSDVAGERNFLFNDLPEAHGLWSKYYRNKHKKIDDSRIIKAFIYLNDKDISRFDFRQPVYIEIEGNGAYFEVEMIDGYDPDSIESTRVKLIKQVGKVALINLAGVKRRKTKPTGPSLELISTRRTDSGNTYLYMGDERIMKIDKDLVVSAGGGGNPVYAKITDSHQSIMATIGGKLVPVIMREADEDSLAQTTI